MTDDPNSQTDTPRGPMLIDLAEDEGRIAPEQAPMVAETSGSAMQGAVAVARHRPSALARWFWRLALSFVALLLSVGIWNTLTALYASNSLVGGVAIGLGAALGAVALGIALRELAALARLRRIDQIRTEAEAARTEGNLAGARAVLSKVMTLLGGRPEATWDRQRTEALSREAVDADAVLDMAEHHLVAPLDKAALAEVERAARQVATVTALVPLALADIGVALIANLRMIRAIAAIYGGRPGTLGAWRLTRAVLAHLAATGMVAVGDDLLGSVAGGSLLSKVSRRFGEGLVNGALTARVGVAAMELCRPLPFEAVERPSVGATVKRALTGLFGSND